MRSNILILGHFGAGNLGDEVMLDGLLRIIGTEWPREFHARVIWRGAYPPPTQLEDRVSLEPVEPAVIPMLSALFKSDAVLMAGGTHFHDDYPFPRLVRHWRYLARYVVVQWLATAMGKPVGWIGVGVGPLRRWPTRLLTKLAARSCRVIHVRDHTSLEEVADLDPALKHRLVAGQDLAHFAQYDPPPSSRRGVIVIPTRLWALPNDQSVAYWEWLGTELGRLCDPMQTTMTLAAARATGRENDQVEIDAVLRGLTARGWTSARALRFDGSIGQFFDGLASSGDKVIAARFHGLLTSVLLGKAVLAVSYHQKVASIAGAMGLPTLLGSPEADGDLLRGFLAEPGTPVKSGTHIEQQWGPVMRALERCLKVT